MQVSLAGVLVCLALLTFGRLSGATLLTGMLGSLAFGTTSVVLVSALGGASPLVYAVFAALLCGSAFFSRHTHKILIFVSARSWTPLIVCGLAAYACASAVLFPRLFSGATNVFVSVRGIGVLQVALVPTSGNITQTAYFLLGAATYLAVVGDLVRPGRLIALRNAFLWLAALHAITGAIDLLAKALGIGDVFMLLRSATFSMLTDVDQAGFSRITGTYSEASSFAAAGLASLAFTFSDWYSTGSRVSGTIAAVLLALLALSTSSTAYVGIAALTMPTGLSLCLHLAKGRVRTRDLTVVALVLATIALVCLCAVWDPRVLEPFAELLQTAVFNKLQSESAHERAYWNQQSLASLADTVGFGVGFGSSRASNWLIAFASQVGIIGCALLAMLLLSVGRWAKDTAAESTQAGVLALRRSFRACFFAVMVGGAISGGSADPGLLFFLALAGLTASNVLLALGRSVAVWPVPNAQPVRLAPAGFRNLPGWS